MSRATLNWIDKTIHTGMQLLQGDANSNDEPEQEIVALSEPYLGPYHGEVWAQNLLELFPSFFLGPDGKVIPFAHFHAGFWRHIYSITKEERPEPDVEIWSRGTGKSTNGEMACVDLGARDIRKYALYVCGTQDQADDHVQNIGGLLERKTVADKYPLMSERLLSKFGYSRGWKVNRLRTAQGFIVDAIGLDKAMRGARLEEYRPDLIVFDDIDSDTDTPKAIQKKIQAITRKIIPAGAHNVAIIFLQNLIHANSIASQLVKGTADFLLRRKVSGPYPAIEDLTYQKVEGNKVRVTGGRPLWQGLDLDRFQSMMDDSGFNATMVECQHETQMAHGMFLNEVWNKSIHVIKPFEIPRNWRIDRSFDWGSAKPYANGWWAESDGETPVEWHDGKLRWFPKGTLFLIRELYGCEKNPIKPGEVIPNKGVRHSAKTIAQNILDVEVEVYWGDRVKDGPADSSIFDAEDEDSDSIFDRMKNAGVTWEKANKKPGSRVDSASKIVEMLEAVKSFPMEGPGLYVFDCCTQTIRTIPELPTSTTNPDDVDTDAEDHCWDMMRYRILHRRLSFGVANTTGH